MSALLTSVFSWGDLFTVALVLIALYFALTFVHRMLPRFGFSEQVSLPLQKGIHGTLLIYEPLVLMIIGTVFLLINPLFHGLLLALPLVAGFKHLKNYISGRLVQFDPAIRVGKRLKIDPIQGIIAERGRLGLRLRSNKGLHFIAYSKLWTDGYLLLSGEEIGGSYLLSVSPKQSEEKVDYASRLSDLLATSPYLDWSYTPELKATPHGDYAYQVRISVREESHLRDLVSLIEEEWGFDCKISKNKN